MQVRPFRFPADLETMLAIAAASFQYDDHPEWSLPSDLALIMRRQLQAIRFTLPLLQALSVFDARLRRVLGGVVADVDGQAVGVTNIARLYQTPRIEIGNVSVLEAHRRQGIAHKMMDACIACARQWGAQRVELNVIAGNTPALTLYEQMGFTTIAFTEEYVAYDLAPYPIPQLPAPYHSRRLAFGDGRARASLLQSLGRDITAPDLNFLRGLRWVAPLFFRLAGMGFWGRTVLMNHRPVATLSMIFQPGTNTATLTLHPDHLQLATPLLEWIMYRAYVHAPQTPLALTLEQTGLDDILKNHGFDLDFRYQRLQMNF